MAKKVAVLFSGGLDSTYLIWKNLTEGNEVYPIYIDIENNGAKTILEKNRIELLRKEFLKEFEDSNSYSWNSKLKEINYLLKLNINANERSVYFKQVPIWIFGIVFSQSLGVDEIQIGYVMNDDAISYLDDIKNIYNSYQPICEPLIPLAFPLTKNQKCQMVDELPKQYLDLIISCENPRIIGSENAEIIKYEPCCECVPCSHIIESDYYGIGKFPDNYEDNLLMKSISKIRKAGYKIIDKNGDEFFSKYEMLTPKIEPYQLSIDFSGEGIVKSIEII